MHHFGLEKILEAHLTTLSAITRRLVATEGGAVLVSAAIDVHRARPERARQSCRSLGITCLNISRKTVGCIVRDPDGVLFGVKRNNR